MIVRPEFSQNPDQIDAKTQIARMTAVKVSFNPKEVLLRRDPEFDSSMLWLPYMYCCFPIKEKDDIERIEYQNLNLEHIWYLKAPLMSTKKLHLKLLCGRQSNTDMRNHLLDLLWNGSLESLTFSGELNPLVDQWQEMFFWLVVENEKFPSVKSLEFDFPRSRVF